jgi:class 3 adenylate cyclase/tetratricopeptide (TPR) repeat protein
VPEIAEWLEDLGLAKYVGAFASNEIDFETLPFLTESVLERIGLPLGPRIKVLAAVSELRPRPNPSLAVATGAANAEPREAERRQITVLFSDLVNSTVLAERLDPEDLRSLLNQYQGACRSIVERYEGYLARYMGDGIMAYFGWPKAHEDAAERAVRAGLEIVEAVKRCGTPEPLSVRIGISTGMVVVGYSADDDPSIPSDAAGVTLHVAARLQALAAPDSVIIAEGTSRLVAAHFDQEDLGPYDLKGLECPIHAFRVRRPRDESIRFQLNHPGTLTPLVGRRSELALLHQRWQDAKAGEGQAVFVSGVPGIGKSRIAHELAGWIKGEDHFSLNLQCLPHCTQSALFPVTRQIERLARLEPGQSDRAKLKKIKRLLSVATDQAERALPLVAAMMSISKVYRIGSSLSPQQIKTQTLSVLVQLLVGLSARRPVLCLVEDAQWIDASTQELLELTIAQIQSAKILLIVTHRPEYRMPESMDGNVSAITISRLGHRDVTEMTKLALRNHAVFTGVIDSIVRESDSIPLFVEELARGVVESGSPGAHGRRDGLDVSITWSIPESLRDSFMARLDRAPQAHTVAQMAAVIGREFSYDILLKVSELKSLELDSALAHLKQNDIVQLTATVPYRRYTFKHALLRDVAYETLLNVNRREIHSRVGSVLESEWPEVVSSQPELLAYHYSMGSKMERAAQYWLMGGRRARDRSANAEAAVQFERALECLQKLPETPERRRAELDTQLLLGLCFIALRGYSADDTRRSFERARALSVELREHGKEIQAIFGLWGHYWMRARHDRAVELGETLLLRARSLGDPVALIVGHRSLGSTLFTSGDFIRAREHLERVIAPGQDASAGESDLSFAVDPRIAARLMLGWVLWILGYPDQALQHARQALDHAVEQRDPYSVAFAHYVVSAVHLLRGDWREALQHCDESSTISREHRINLYALYSRFGRGCALARLGQLEDAAMEIAGGIEEARRSDLGYMRAFMLGWLATVQSEGGDPQTSLLTIDEGFRHIDDVSGRAWEAELNRLRGDMLLAASANSIEEAEASYRKALSVAQSQRARSLELRSAVSLMKLLKARGREEEARPLLAAIFGSFNEGFDTADLREATELLKKI